MMMVKKKQTLKDIVRPFVIEKKKPSDVMEKYPHLNKASVKMTMSIVRNDILNPREKHAFRLYVKQSLAKNLIKGAKLHGRKNAHAFAIELLCIIMHDDLAKGILDDDVT
jgi:hypothetical protein